MRVLSNIFKSKTKEIWQQLASEISGEFVDGGIWNSDKVTLAYRNTTIVLDLYSKSSDSTLIRVQCQFITTERFTFNVANESIFTRIKKIFGLNDIQVGDIRFDDKFYLKSAQKDKLIYFFNSEKVREQFLEILKNLNYKLNVEVISTKPFFAAYDKDNPYKSLRICLEEPFISDNITKLKLWFEICKITLDRLIEIGEAEDVNPIAD